MLSDFTGFVSVKSIMKIPYRDAIISATCENVLFNNNLITGKIYLPATYKNEKIISVETNIGLIHTSDDEIIEAFHKAGLKHVVYVPMKGGYLFKVVN